MRGKTSPKFDLRGAISGNLSLLPVHPLEEEEEHSKRASEAGSGRGFSSVKVAVKESSFCG